MTFDALLQQAAVRLSEAQCASPRLDAEVLLGFAAGRDRTWLYTWGDRECESSVQATFDALLSAREQGEPVAYLTGEREFWGLPLATSRDTLIPRPDTETLVEAVLQRAEAVLESASAPRGRLLDLGTGTGAIALAFASERPAWQVVGADLRADAVALAARNAERLAITNATFLQSDWFSAFEETADAASFAIIVSNPPYLAPDDPHLEQGDVRFEPHSALVAKADGLADLLHLVKTARRYLLPGGCLALEHGFEQAAAVREAMADADFRDIESVRDLGGHERVTLGLIG